MAESQVPYSYSAHALREIEFRLSIKRFGTYMVKAGHRREYAIQLYLYNARLAKSLLFPLHVMEVVLRNGIDDVMTRLFGVDWPSDQTFRNILSPQSNNSLQKTITRLKKRPCKYEIISQLSLDFWSNLFRPEYDRSVWQTQMPYLFPNHTITRAAFAPDIIQLNRLRNRIAHHEPVIDLNTSSDHQKILDIIGYRSSETKNWVKAHSTFAQMVRTKPRIGSPTGLTMADRADPDILRTSLHARLCDLPASTHSFFIATNDRGADEAIFDRNDIASFILARQDNGIIDLAEHPVEQLLAVAGSRENFIIFDESESLSNLANAFKKRIRFVGVSQSIAPNHITGVIAKAHRRY